MSYTNHLIRYSYKGNEFEANVRKGQLSNEPVFYYLEFKTGWRRIQKIDNKWKITAGLPIHPNLFKTLCDAIDQQIK